MTVPKRTQTLTPTLTRPVYHKNLFRGPSRSRNHLQLHPNIYSNQKRATSTTSLQTTLAPAAITEIIDILTSSPENPSQDNTPWVTTSQSANQPATAPPQREPLTRNLAQPSPPQLPTLDPASPPPPADEQRFLAKKPSTRVEIANMDKSECRHPTT